MVEFFNPFTKTSFWVADDRVDEYKAAGYMPKDLKVLDVAVAESAVQHDMNTSALGDPVGLISGINVINFEADKEITQTVCDVLADKKIPYQKGVIASGDMFVDTDKQRDHIRQNFMAIACEMEGAAIAHVCYAQWHNSA